ncbi:phosphoheptose isomerase [Sphaerochaeta pleomorpha str. Grapes]|uniref:Phosphoheptose isomerase n=1 Tax=Sphaerochaeta pleomorpha (strain ATCC BAA-1885 / DSM 22778 / Grapes) TaxID=158190 RepID=G8QTC7_SPHPG|nr:SIS domain-containing protein [Sphaerochaeta pleomorpha]AEV29094.1 phosphoheptose isomerase [Sphaerochaeta pleomorpha str. Grapes]
MHKEIEALIERYPQLKPMAQDIEKASSILIKSIKEGGKVLVCGNGGSSSDADHIVGELMKSFAIERPLDKSFKEQLVKADLSMGSVLAKHLQGAIPAINLGCHTALSSAFNNDVDPALVFAQQVHGYGKSGDVLLGLSTSGNAKNVNYAAVTALAKGMHVIGMTGETGGALAGHCTICLKVPQRETYKVQELHLPLYHTLCLLLENEFFL